MIKEQQDNLINLQKLYEGGQRFVSKKDQMNNIMDILAAQQRSKNITLDKDAPASFHVYKSYKSKKPSSSGKKTDKMLQSKSSNDNSTIGSTFYNSNQSSYPNTFLEHGSNDDHLSIVNSQRTSLNGNSHAQMSILSPQGSVQTSRSNNSPMLLERSTTPLSMRPGSSHAASNTSLTNSPSLVGSLGSKTRGRKATKRQTHTTRVRTAFCLMRTCRTLTTKASSPTICSMFRCPQVGKTRVSVERTIW